jgi:arylmalonate decarboxylase
MRTNTSRREFLKAGIAGVALSTVSVPARLVAADKVVGLIFPPANYPVPPEAQQLYPTIRFLSEGVGLERMTPAEYDRVMDRVIPAAIKLAKAGAEAISVNGSSLTFYKGAAFNHDLIESVKKATGVPATTQSMALVNGLKVFGARRVGVATAYTQEVDRRLKIFLEESGFDVLAIRGLDIERFEDRPPVTQDDVLKLAVSVRETVPQADAMVISCGALRTIDILAPFEERCKLPVVSSNPHGLWDAVRLVGHSGKALGFGTLLAKG